MNRIKDITLLALALGLIIGISSMAKFAPLQASQPQETSHNQGLNVGIHFDDLKGIDISRVYIWGQWRYAVTHLVPPGHRYHFESRLYYRGQEVQDPSQLNDYITTPWGNLYWVGRTPVTRYGSRGWVRVPDPRYPLGINVTPTHLKG